MAKTKTTTHKFYIVDLIRQKPRSQYIEIPKYRVDVEIEVTTKGKLSAKEVPSAAMERLEKTARKKLEEYEKIITEEAFKLDKKISELMKQPSKKAQQEAEKLTQGVNASIKNALDSAEGAAQKAIEARLKKEAQGDKNLKEARVRTGLKVGKSLIKITGSVGKLVASAGADVSSYVTITKELVSLGKELQQQLKNEEKLRKDLQKGVTTYVEFRGDAIMKTAKKIGLTDTSGIDFKKPLDAIKEVTKRVAEGGEAAKKEFQDPKTGFTKLKDIVVKGVKAKLADAEKARKAYREHTTKTRHKVDDMSAKADKLQKAMRAAKNLKAGVKIGAQCMQVKHGVSAMASKLDDREKFLDSMQEVLSEAGMKIDDRTTLDKLKELDKKTIMTEAKDLLSSIKSVKGAVEAVASAVV
jgi:hypothetical protein